jgi:WD40 repeat protein
VLAYLVTPHFPARSFTTNVLAFHHLPTVADDRSPSNATKTALQQQAPQLAANLQSDQVTYSLVLNDDFSVWASSLVFSADGRTLASGGHYEVSKGAVIQNGARLWKLNYDPDQNLKIDLDPRIFGGYASIVRSVAISPDGRTLATGSYDALVKLWNLNQVGEQPRVLTGQKKAIYTVAFSADGKILASAGRDQQISLWNPTTGAVRGKLPENDDINSIAISPNSQLVASGSKDKAIRLWDLTTGKLLRTLTGHDGEVNAVAFSPDGRTLASGSDDKTVKLWNVNGEQLHTLLKHSGKVNTVAFSPNGRTLASGGEDTTINLWDVFDGELLYTRGKHDGTVYSIVFNPVEPYFASGGNDGKVRLWTY